MLLWFVRTALSTNGEIPGSPTVVAGGLTGDIAKRRDRQASVPALSRFHRIERPLCRYKRLSGLSSCKCMLFSRFARFGVEALLERCRRDGDGCWRDVVWIYHRDTSSPSGVKLAASGDKSIVEPLLRSIVNNSPLSPAEYYR